MVRAPEQAQHKLSKVAGESYRLRTCDLFHPVLSGRDDYMRKHAAKAIENSYLLDISNRLRS
jgi:hypothetical protein